MKKDGIYKLVLSAMFFAIALILPLITGQIPQIGSMLLPMHIPVLLCGYFCGPLCGAAVGLFAPIIRSFLFGMPVLMPTGIAMCFELFTYGLVSGLMYKLLPKKPIFVYVSLITAMITGRAVWGMISAIIYGVSETTFGLEMFITGAFAGAVPGIIIQIVIVPLLVITLRKLSFVRDIRE